MLEKLTLPPKPGVKSCPWSVFWGFYFSCHRLAATQVNSCRHTPRFSHRPRLPEPTDLPWTACISWCRSPTAWRPSRESLTTNQNAPMITALTNEWAPEAKGFTGSVVPKVVYVLTRLQSHNSQEKSRFMAEMRVLCHFVVPNRFLKVNVRLTDITSVLIHHTFIILTN